MINKKVLRKVKRRGSVLLIATLLMFLFWLLPWSKTLDNVVYDALQTYTTTIDTMQNDLVVVGIDDVSLERFSEPLILWHAYLGDVINGMSKGGVESIGIDLILSVSLKTLMPERERTLIRSLLQTRRDGIPVTLGFQVGENGQMPHRNFLLGASGIGFLNLFPDSDNITRTQVIQLTDKDHRKAYSLASAIIGTPMLTTNTKIAIDYRLPLPTVISFSRVYDWAKTGNIDRLQSAFQGKRVIIGVTSPKLGDLHYIPVALGHPKKQLIPGVFIHALTAQTLLAGHYFREIANQWLIIIMLILSILSGLLFFQLPPLKAIITGLIVLSLISLCVVIGFYQYWLIPASALLFSTIIPGTITAAYRYFRQHRELRQLRHLFGCYVSPDVLSQLEDESGQVKMSGEQTEMTIMFTDIRNFVTLSEPLSPQVLVKGLNDYFSEMTKSVIQQEGYLNRYIGDAVLALFGAPKKLPQSGALAAVRCGFDMLERLEKLNQKGLFPSGDAVSIGIGIHTGDAVVGNIGCYEKMDYTVIGDAVNVASRIEGLTKEYKTPLLVSEETYEKIKDHVEGTFIDSCQVKGRKCPVNLYAITKLKDD